MQDGKTPVVMQIIPRLGEGGAEQGCIDVAAELIRSGSKSIVVSSGGPRLHEIMRAKAEHISAPMHSKNPFVMYANIARIRNLIKTHHVDIVHVRSRAPAWSAWFACQGTQASFMTTCHAPYNFNNPLKRFYNAIMTKGKRVIAISEYVANYIHANYVIEPQRVQVVPRGIDMGKFHPSKVSAERVITVTQDWRIPDGASVVLLPGRLTRWKGHHVLIEALARMKNRKDVFCVLLGSDQGRKDYRHELERAINEKELSGLIRIVDHCKDMPAAYMAASIVVSASTDPEGFGRVPVESQAMGRPIIATDHGGATETVIHNQTGWLVPPDDPATLAAALDHVLSLNADERSHLAENAMTHVAAKFTREKMVDTVMNIYASLLEEKLGGHRPEQNRDAA